MLTQYFLWCLFLSKQKLLVRDMNKRILIDKMLPDAYHYIKYGKNRENKGKNYNFLRVLCVFFSWLDSFCIPKSNIYKSAYLLLHYWGAFSLMLGCVRCVCMCVCVCKNKFTFWLIKRCFHQQSSFVNVYNRLPNTSRGHRKKHIQNYL